MCIEKEDQRVFPHLSINNMGFDTYRSGLKAQLFNSLCVIFFRSETFLETGFECGL